MYLDLGQAVVSTRNVIGIFDLDSATVAKPTRETLRKAEKKGETVTLGADIPRAFVVVEEDRAEKQTVYLSQVSPQTLIKRADEGL